MSPGVSFEDVDRVAHTEVSVVGIVVDNASNSGKQILPCTPPETMPERHFLDFCDFGFPTPMKVVAPLVGVRIGRLTEFRKQVEFEMIVRIDQPRINEAP